MNVDPLWTTQLHQVLSNNFVTRPLFKGVYAADELPSPQFLRRVIPWYIVVNTDPSYRAGKHWLLFGADNPYTLTVFDSYGLDFTKYYAKNNRWFLRFLQSFTNIKENLYPFQSVTTNVCGHYCIYVAIQRATLGIYDFQNLPELVPYCFRQNDQTVAHIVSTTYDPMDVLKDVPLINVGQSCTRKNQ